MDNSNSIDNNPEQRSEGFGGNLPSENTGVNSASVIDNTYADVPHNESTVVAEEPENVENVSENTLSDVPPVNNPADTAPVVQENVPKSNQPYTEATASGNLHNNQNMYNNNAMPAGNINTQNVPFGCGQSSYGVYTQYRGDSVQQNVNTQGNTQSNKRNVEQQRFQQPVYQQPPYQQQGAGYVNTDNFSHMPQQGFDNANNFNQMPQGYGNPANFNQTQQTFGNPYETNPYQQNTNPQMNQMPQVQYMPYTPGTILPEGITPQFINGGWYYPYVVLPNQKKPKKKMATSVKVLLGIIAGITVAFIVLLFVWSFNLDKDGSSSGDSDNGFSFEFELPGDDNSSDHSSGEVGKYADPNGPEITLVENDTQNGSTEKAYEVLSDSVVSVSTYEEDESPSTSTPLGEGTGIIISEDGYIVTNSHVIDDKTEGNVWVTTKEGSVFSAVIVGCDVRTDIAVLKCDDAKGWKSASFANSEQLKVGQDVVALGSPGGSSYSNSLTRGIISALNRALSGSAVTYIQTDAAINPGNSGGPLANMNGQVIGINTIKVVDTEYEGMGFAIPSVTIKEVADELIKNGYVKGRARIGIVGREVSKSMAKLTGGEAGIYINKIEDDSPLKDTKVKVGDTITAIDGKSVTTFNELFSTLDTYSVGETITLTICRNSDNLSDKETFTVTITLVGE